MAGNLSDYAENKILEHLVGKNAFAMPTVYVALLTSVAGDANAGTEVSGGNYARLATTASDWTAASAGAISNAVDFEWNTASASWGTVVGLTLMDAPTGGNVLVHGSATSSKAIDAGDTYRIVAGNLSFLLN